MYSRHAEPDVRGGEAETRHQTGNPLPGLCEETVPVPLRSSFPDRKIGSQV